MERPAVVALANGRSEAIMTSQLNDEKLFEVSV